MVELDARDARARGLSWPARWVAPAAVAVSAAVWTLAVQGIDHRFVSFSDGAYTYIAAAVAGHGAHQLYGTVVLSQPPAVVLGAAGLWRLAPHVETIRLALALLGILTSLLTYAVARANRLAPGLAAAAAVVALTAPIHAQFSGLDGEALLTPLALGLALALHRRRPATAGLFVGAGFFVKLTWLPFALAALLIVARNRGRRALGATLLVATAAAAALYGASLAAFGWKPGDLLAEIVLGQSGSGLQLGMLGGIVVVTLLGWWPLVPLAAAGAGSLARPSRALLVAGLAAGAFAVKQGTFFNVLDPAEPFLAVAAAAGAASLWRRRFSPAKWLVAACSLGLVLHITSLTGDGARRALPLPVGAAVVRTDDEADVDRAARTIRASSSQSEPVLVNPFLAVVAGRNEMGGQADWFILRALERSCGGDASAPARCHLWAGIKRNARLSAAVVGVDSNVRSFDSGFARETGAAGRSRLLRIDAPPLDLTLYGR